MKKFIIMFSLCIVLAIAFVACNDGSWGETDTSGEEITSEIVTNEPTTEAEISAVETEAPTSEEATTDTEAESTDVVTTESVTTEPVTTEPATTAPETEALAGGGGGSSGGGGGGGASDPVNPCANGHDKEFHEAKAATCTEVGYDAYETCKRSSCKYTTYKEIPTLKHDEEQHEAKAATCTEEGYDAYVSCKRAGCTYTTKGADIPSLGHDEERHEAKASTCTEAGYDAYVSCKREGCTYSTKGAEIPALGHDEERYEAKASTCTEAGYDTYVSCKREGCDYSTKAEIPKTDHSYVDGLCACGTERFDVPTEGINVYYANDISKKSSPVADGVINDGEYGDNVIIVEEPIKMVKDYPDYNLIIDDTSTRPSGGRVEYHFAYDDEYIYIALKEYGQTFDDGSTVSKAYAERNNYSFCYGFDPYDMKNYISHSVTYGDFCWNGNLSISNGKAYGHANTGAKPDEFYYELFVNKYPLSQANIPADERTTLYAYGDLLSAHNGNASSPYVLELEIKLNKKDSIDFFNNYTGTKFSDMPDAMWFFMTATTRRPGDTLQTGISKYLVNDIRDYSSTEKNKLFQKYGGLTDSRVEFVPSVIVFADKNEDVIIPPTDPCANGHDIVSHEAKAPTCNGIGWNAYQTCTRCNYTTFEMIQKLPHDFGEDGKCGCGSEEDPSTLNGAFKAGYARVDITPDTPINKKGSGKYQEINDNLYATCIAVSDGDNTALLFTVDVSSIRAKIDKNFKKAITKATGVPAENIIISATHTHTAPTPGIPSSGANNMRWLTDLDVYMADAAKQAIEDLSETEIYKGTQTVSGMAFVRRWIYKDGTPGGIWRGYSTDRTQIDRYESDADNSVQIIRFVREDKKDIVMANLQTHFTSAGSYVEGISADLGDILRTAVEKEDDDALFAVYLGASGNITPIAYIADLKVYSNYMKMGAAVAKEIVEATPTLQKVNAGKIVSTALTVTTKVRKEDDTTVGNAEKAQAEIKALNQYDGDKEVYDIATKYGFESAKEVNSIVSRNNPENYGATRDHLIGAISFGDLAFVSAPYEMFDTNGMQIKDGSPFGMTFVITNAGGAGSYVPSAIAVPNGGYEVYTAVDEFGTAERMVEEFLKMLRAHKNSSNQ